MARSYLLSAIVAATLLLSGSVGPLAAQPHEDTAAEQHATEPGGHTADAAHDEKPNPMTVDPDLGIWTFVVFVLLLGVLWKFAWGPIAAGLDKRERSIEDHIKFAERSHDEAKRLLAEYEQKLELAADEVRGMLDEARRDAEHTKQEILVEAKAGADAERARALRDIETATNQALKTLAERSADLAVDLAGKIVRTKLTAQEHAQLVQDAVTRFPEASPNQN